MGTMTTTAWTGCDVGVWLDNQAGALADIGGSSNSVEIDLKQEIGDYRAFGTPWKGRIQCGRDASIKLKIMATKAQAEAMRIALDWFFVKSQNTLKPSRLIHLIAIPAATGLRVKS